MLGKRLLKWTTISFLSLFAISFLLSYNLSSRGFFDFEKYLEDLRTMAQEGREKLTGDGSKESQAGEDGDIGSDGEPDQNLNGDQFADLYYESLSSYKGKNPYNTFLTDRDIVRNIRYIIGDAGYKFFLKSISNSDVVMYDESSDIYTVKGYSEQSRETLAGIVQVKETGQMYLAYLDGEYIRYYTNDLNYLNNVVDNKYMDEWMEKNSESREILYPRQIDQP